MPNVDETQRLSYANLKSIWDYCFSAETLPKANTDEENIYIPDDIKALNAQIKANDASTLQEQDKLKFVLLAMEIVLARKFDLETIIEGLNVASDEMTQWKERGKARSLLVEELSEKGINKDEVIAESQTLNPKCSRGGQVKSVFAGIGTYFLTWLTCIFAPIGIGCSVGFKESFFWGLILMVVGIAGGAIGAVAGLFAGIPAAVTMAHHVRLNNRKQQLLASTQFPTPLPPKPGISTPVSSALTQIGTPQSAQQPLLSSQKLPPSYDAIGTYDATGNSAEISSEASASSENRRSQSP